MKQINVILTFLMFSLTYVASAQQDTVLIKTFGGPFFEEAASVIRCAQGGYAVIGTTGSNETGNTDMFLLRLDDELNCLWHRNYGGSQVEWGISLVEDLSGNFLLCGYTSSYGNGAYDIEVNKVSPVGDLLWNNTYGGDDWDFGTQITRHPAGGFLVAGNTYSFGSGNQDGLIMHIDGNGTELHAWYFGGAQHDAVEDLVALADGWAAIGHTTINDTVASAVWRLDIQGELMWSHIRTDSLRELRGKAIVSDGVYFYCTGSRTADGVMDSYLERLHPEGNPIMYEGNAHLMEDCAVWNGDMSFVGKSNLVGFGGFDGYMEHYTVDYGYLGGVFAATGKDERFESIIETVEGIMMCGSFETDDLGDQAAIMLYRRPTIFSDLEYPTEELGCYTLAVEGDNQLEEATFELVDVMDLQGRTILHSCDIRLTQVCNPIECGIYIIRDTKTGATKKQFID